MKNLIVSLLLTFILLALFSCGSNNSNNGGQKNTEPIGQALIDGVSEDGTRYNVNIWQAPDPERGKIITSLPPNSKLQVFSIQVVNGMPWFNVETETGMKGNVNILHLKNIQIESDYLKNIDIDYQRIQEENMLSDQIMARKRINTL